MSGNKKKVNHNQKWFLRSDLKLLSLKWVPRSHLIWALKTESKGQQPFLSMLKIVNIFRIIGYVVYIIYTQLWCCSTKTGNGNMQMNGQTCSTKILFMRPCGVLDLEYRVKIADSGLRESPGIDSQKEHFWKKGDYKFVEKLHGVIMRRQVLLRLAFSLYSGSGNPWAFKRKLSPEGKDPCVIA